MLNSIIAIHEDDKIYLITITLNQCMYSKWVFHRTYVKGGREYQFVINATCIGEREECTIVGEVYRQRNIWL